MDVPFRLFACPGLFCPGFWSRNFPVAEFVPVPDFLSRIFADFCPSRNLSAWVLCLSRFFLGLGFLSRIFSGRLCPAAGPDGPDAFVSF